MRDKCPAGLCKELEMNTLVRVTALRIHSGSCVVCSATIPGHRGLPRWPQDIVVANCCLKFQPIPLFRRGICFCRCELDGVS